MSKKKELYLGTDLSTAKTGIAILSVENRKPKIELAYLITSNKDKELHIRIDETVTEIKHLAGKYDVMAVVKEQGFVGRVETAVPIAKTHAIFEHVLTDRFVVDNVHNTSIKAYARKIIGKEREKELKKEEPKKHSKLLIKEAVEKYYGEVPELYTPRGAYIDDIGDAILLMTLWLENQDLIDIQHRYEP